MLFGVTPRLVRGVVVSAPFGLMFIFIKLKFKLSILGL
ncbi:hypothetical protein PALI_a0996 [Pseudoalteromonas aliena SW19]|jgi:hypothetical protein|uniref:Uncharacterized protein n=1 Tax=Pseudoalteromonas aliena SW19 TaxID=1314866 RepID=A0ABR9DZF9_9GAMM|nr:hypothetical protein [Pseudoalteromonas aliena SW19]